MKNTDSLDEILSQSANELAHDPPTQIPFWSSLLHPLKLLAVSRKLDESAAFQRYSHRQLPFLFLLFLYSTSYFLLAWLICIVIAFLSSGDFYILNMIVPGIVLGTIFGYVRAIKDECERVNSKLEYRINGKTYRKFIGG